MVEELRDINWPTIIYAIVLIAVIIYVLVKADGDPDGDHL